MFELDISVYTFTYQHSFSKILFTKLFESPDQGKEANKVEQDIILKTGEFRTV